jgi:nucleotide-binding universal stress UspA family protein
VVKETMLMEPRGEQERRIVVGVDGSASSKAALGWAIQQAKLTGAVVDAVIAWDYPGTYGYPAAVGDDADYEALATEVVANAVAEVSGPAAPAEIRPKAVRGNAASVLLAASAGADLLVVGSRGHGGFVEALLGSVSQHAVHHATCPVVVIRDSLAGR